MTESLERDEELHEPLARIVARAAVRDATNVVYGGDRFAQWLVRDAQHRYWTDAGATPRDVERFAAIVASRVATARLLERYPRHTVRERSATVTGTFAQTVALAARERCAPRVDLRVAAGVGRELWDEACDAWIELPAGVPRGEYVALTVGGDSMTPLLEDGDVILVNPSGKVMRDRVIVARRPEDGYVVKHVARLGRRELQLASLNPAYAPFTIARDPALIVGTLVARLGHERLGHALGPASRDGEAPPCR